MRAFKSARNMPVPMPSELVARAKDGSPGFNSGHAPRLVKPYMAVKLFFIILQKCVNMRAVQQRVE